MPNQHKSPMLGWHPPAGLSAWARDEAERRGVPLSVILTEALAEKRDRAAESDRERDTVMLEAIAAPGTRIKAQRAAVGELLGIDPDWCGGQAVDEYVRDQRTRGGAAREIIGYQAGGITYHPDDVLIIRRAP